MSRLFINRPIFAWVLAIFVILAGVLAIPRLAVERYPAVAPPSVSIYASYPGASAQTMNDAVVGLIERELSSVKHLLYFESSVDTSGEASITATFKPGTDPELAQVDVQNRIKAIEPRLPRSVRQNGLFVEAADSGFLMLVGLRSPDASVSEAALGDFMARNIIEELRRIDGVGRVQLFGAEQAMRIWLDPTRLTGYGLTMGDVASAIEQQNLEISPGRIGDSPGVPGQRITVPLSAEGQLSTPGQFAAIVLRAGADGSRVLLGDVARVELGAQSYAWGTREDGYPATAAGVQLRPGANAVRTATAVRERMAALQPLLPHGVESSIPFDTAPFVKVSIQKVLQTLVEAMLLVFAVMYLFLQNWRYTLIPALVAPIALLGTFAVMLALGFSINVLTMFGMVLAIGIIVDDAIVVVENVERIMAKEGLGPKEATIKAMKEKGEIGNKVAVVNGSKVRVTRGASGPRDVHAGVAEADDVRPAVAQRGHDQFGHLFLHIDTHVRMQLAVTRQQRRQKLAAQHARQVPLFVKIAPDLDNSQIEIIAATLMRYGADSTGLANDAVLAAAAIKALGYDEFSLWIDSGQTFARKRDSLKRFIEDVMPAFQ